MQALVQGHVCMKGDILMGNYKGVKLFRRGLLTALCVVMAATTAIVIDADKLKGQTQRTTVTKRTTVPPSARVRITGMFMGWGVGRYRMQPTVAIKFTPKGRSTKAMMNTPSITPNCKTALLDPYDLRVARRLKLGDTIEMDYASYNGWVWMLELHRVGYPRVPRSKSKSRSGSKSKRKARPKSTSANTPQVPSDKFVFVGAKKVKSSDGLRMDVLVRRGPNMWSFPAPYEPPPTILDSEKTNGDDPKSDKPKTLSQQVDRKSVV